MKTKNGMEYKYIAGSPRLIDLGDRLNQHIKDWVNDGNLTQSEFVTVLMYTNGLKEVPHRITCMLPPKGAGCTCPMATSPTGPVILHTEECGR